MNVRVIWLLVAAALPTLGLRVIVPTCTYVATSIRCVRSTCSTYVCVCVCVCVCARAPKEAATIGGERKDAWHYTGLQLSSFHGTCE